MPETSEWTFRNVARQPVELHLTSGVLVLPPRGTLTTADPEPLCLALLRQGVLTRHAIPQPGPQGEAPSEPMEQTERQSSRQGQRSTAGEGKAKRGTKKTSKSSTRKKTTRTRARKSKAATASAGNAEAGKSEDQNSKTSASEEPSEGGKGDTA